MEAALAKLAQRILTQIAQREVRQHGYGRLAAIAVIALVGPFLLIIIPGFIVASTLAASQAASDTTTGNCAPSGDTPTGVGASGLDAEQTDTARQILAVASSLNVPTRGWVVAIGVALQESGLRPLTYGDASSLGPFQQLDAWGPATDRINPTSSARMFFQGGQAGQRGLLAVPGWEQMSFAEAAQAVQHAAFPSEYAKQEAPAIRIVTELSGQIPTAPCAGGTGPVYILGDSITVGSEPDLRAALAGRQVTVNAAVGRTLSQGLPFLAADQSQLAGVTLVVALCTNYGGDQAQFAALIDQTMQIATPASTVVWVTCTEWSPAQTAANAAIRAAVNPKSVVAEWAQPSQAPGVLGSDGIHPTIAGRAVFARIIADAIPSGAQLVGNYALPLTRDQIHVPLAEHHDGQPAVDMPAPTGTPIFAVAAGTVAFTSDGNGCGLGMEIIDSTGTRWMYCHSSQRLVPNGGTVTTGQQIALVGSTGDSTGPHLHMQIQVAGANRCPQPFLDALVAGQAVDLMSLRTSGPCA